MQDLIISANIEAEPESEDKANLLGPNKDGIIVIVLLKTEWLVSSSISLLLKAPFFRKSSLPERPLTQHQFDQLLRHDGTMHWPSKVPNTNISVWGL